MVLAWKSEKAISIAGFAHIDGGDETPQAWDVNQCAPLVGDCDLILLHVGEQQKYATRALTECFANKLVVCYTGAAGGVDLELRSQIAQKDNWCYYPDSFGTFDDQVPFNGSLEERSLSRYVTLINNGAFPRDAKDAKNVLQNFDLTLETHLDKLYGMLQSGKQTEGIIEERNKLDALLTETAL